MSNLKDQIGVAVLDIVKYGHAMAELVLPLFKFAMAAFLMRPSSHVPFCHYSNGRICGQSSERSQEVRFTSTCLLKAKKSSFDDSIFGSFEEGNVAIPRHGEDFSLYYRIYNNKTRSQASKAPLVVLHGGP